jgi:hypothetical protein
MQGKYLMPTSISASPTRFQVPPDGYTFCSDIMTRSQNLIDRGIWSGMKLERLRRWYKNFQSDEEKYFAACIIDALIFRSDDQTAALLTHLFQRPLVDLMRRDPPRSGPVVNWVERLRSNSRDVRLVAAIKRSDRPHKSAHVVSRLIKRQLGVNPDLIAKPWELAPHALHQMQILVFIDDFLGTGDQFEKLIQGENLHWMFSTAYVVYAPLVAHVDGIDYLKSKFPSLRIVASEILEAQHSLFSSESRAFADQVNTVASARDFYLDLLSQKGITLDPADEFGYGGLGLAYAFEHAVPDNNLPLLWWGADGNWAPLFNR